MNKDPKVPYLRVEHCGDEELFELDSNSNVLVGTGGHCKIRLTKDENVKSLHCILKLKQDNTLEVRDWNTGRTFINGNVISEPSVLTEDDVLSIGDYQLTPVLKSADSEASGEKVTLDESSNSDSVSKEGSVDKANADESRIESVQNIDRPNEDASGGLTVTADSIYDDISVDQSTVYECEPVEESDSKSSSDEFVYDIDADFEDCPNPAPFGFADPTFDSDSSSPDRDEVQLLRMEVDQLRFELAQRDSKLKDEDLLDRKQTERLVTRLEELLDELKKSDARTQELEELLRDSDQAAADEREDRQNLEKWVTELESRVNQREDEAESELQSLRKQLAEARELQKQTDERCHEIIEEKTSEEDPVSSGIVKQLKEQISSLQDQLDEARSESETLRKDLEERSTEANASDSNEASGQTMAEMQLEISRERAEISRQRVELKKLKTELEMKLESPKEVNNADSRIQAMREHLKELHDKEQEEKNRLRESSLTGRIANLLNRVTNN